MSIFTYLLEQNLRKRRRGKTVRAKYENEKTIKPEGRKSKIQKAKIKKNKRANRKKGDNSREETAK